MPISNTLIAETKCIELLFTCPNVLPSSVQSVAVNWQDRAPTDRSLPTPLLYAPTLCPIPVGDEMEKQYEVVF